MKILSVLKIMAITGLMIIAVVNTALAEERVTPVRSNLAGQKSSVLAQTCNGVKIAILDSGSNHIFKEGISLINGSVKDENGHGTLMSRIVKEICPQAELYIIKVMGEDGLVVNEKAIILGIEWAISKEVDVINMSLRVKGSEKLHEVIKKAYGKGILIVAAAGNKSSKMGRLTMDHGLSDMNYEVVCPAKYDEVIAVGALDRRGKVYKKSAGGGNVELLCRGYKGKKAGTSIASAYAAGFAAAINLRNPGIDAKTVRGILRRKSQEKELR